MIKGLSKDAAEMQAIILGVNKNHDLNFSEFVLKL